MKVAIIASLDTSLITFRGELIKAMRANGHDVIGLAPEYSPAIVDKLESIGVRHYQVRMSRAGLNPITDLQTWFEYTRILRRERPDLVLSYTIKPVVYGSFAASSAGVSNIYALITGLGAAFNGNHLKGKILRRVATILYGIALARCKRVFVQNPDIAELFVKEHIAPPKKVVIVAGSGVDTTYYEFSAVPEGPPVFLYLGRLLRDKGIGELVEAARTLKQKFSTARVVLVGAPDPNPASFSWEHVAAWKREGLIEHHPTQDDVRPFLKACTTYVLPSYHEGMPRSTLEALATGRPIITTDTIGCRETILDAHPFPDAGAAIRRGRNGLLVPVRDSQALASAMEWVIKNRDISVSMGREGRKIAETVFDVRHVNSLMLREMNLDSNSCAE